MVPMPTNLLILFFIMTHQSSVPRKSAGIKSEVRGTVTDSNDARISGASIRFRAAGKEYLAETSQDGTYSIHLGPGTYAMSATAGGFCSARRSRFALRDDPVVQFDFQLMVCPTDGPGTLTEKYNYQELAGLIGSSNLKPMVAFACRKEYGRDGPQRYTGPVVTPTGKYFPVVLTYNLHTIRANALTYSPPDHRFIGQGNVIWQNGKGTKVGSRIEFILDSGEPRVNLTE